MITNEKCWIEHTATAQLEKVAELGGVIKAVGLPDLHAGKIPVGIAVQTEGIVYPHLIGGDIGCGMGLFETSCALRKFKQERFVTKLNHIRALEDIPTNNPYQEPCPIYDLGTIGGGNHFAEFQTVGEVYDEERFASLGMDKKQVFLLVHSGSRSFGQQILNRFPGTHGLRENDEAFKEYLNMHNDALLWACRNRAIVAGKLMDYLGYSAEVKPVLDCLHNFLERHDGTWIHRKGAVSARRGIAVIPGSRGSLTYLVQPAEDTELSVYSLSHGAGRKWSRSMCKSRIKNKYDRDSLRQTDMGSRVVCHDTELLFQEAPEAYKNIEHVIASLLEHRLCTVVATLRPLVTYKG
jgi:release factor H-coupled RctB family protein